LKTIKTVYKQELSKITKSKKSGVGTEVLYKPKLAWFEKADSFLTGVTATRTSTSTFVSIFNTFLHLFQISFKIRDKKAILICFAIISKPRLSQIPFYPI
jgi:hypothetical protein